MIAALIIGLAIQSLIGIIQYSFNFNFGTQILGEVTQEQTDYTSLATYRGGGFTNRVGGLIGHPNLYAIYLAMLLPIGLSILFSDIKTFYKFLISITISMGIVSLVLTLSRSGWLSFSIAFIFLMGISFIDKRFRRKYVFARFSTIVLICILALTFSGPILKRINNSDEGAVSFRWEFMQVALDMVMDKPILGFGLNSFVWQMPSYTKYKTYKGNIDRFGENLPVVHNIYLLIWAEQGTVGLALYLIFYFQLLRIAWQGLTTYSQPFLSMVNLGCLGGLLALMVDGMASFFIRNGNCGRIFIIVAGLIVAIRWWHFQNTQTRLAPFNFKYN